MMRFQPHQYITALTLVCLLGLTHSIQAVDVITTVTGLGSPGGDSGDGGDATLAQVKVAHGVAVDADGNVYIADTNNSRIRKIDAATGVITTIAGTGSPGGDSGDGGAATAAKVKNPEGIFVSAAGDIYIADSNNHKIRKIDGATGIMSTFAGTGTSGDTGEGGAATSAKLKNPRGVFVDDAGNVFIADTGNSRIKKVDAGTGIITYLAGQSQAGDTGDGGPATSAELKVPEGVFVDGSGNIFIADTGNNKVRRIDGVSGIITTVAGLGSNLAGDTGEGGPATSAKLKLPEDVAVGIDGNLYIADSANHKIKKIDAVSGIITTISGQGGSGGYGGDDGHAKYAELKSPTSIAWLLDADGETSYLWIADSQNSRIRKITITPGVTLVQWNEVDPND